jgi:hypothetical protein
VDPSSVSGKKDKGKSRDPREDMGVRELRESRKKQAAKE